MMSKHKTSANILYGGDEKPIFRNFKSLGKFSIKRFFCHVNLHKIPVLGELILHKLTANGDTTIIIDGIFSTELTSKDLKAKSIVLAKSMNKNHGISKNDTVGYNF
jgi:hypothetical protein